MFVKTPDFVASTPGFFRPDPIRSVSCCIDTATLLTLSKVLIDAANTLDLFFPCLIEYVVLKLYSHTFHASLVARVPISPNVWSITSVDGFFGSVTLNQTVGLHPTETAARKELVTCDGGAWHKSPHCGLA